MSYRDKKFQVLVVKKLFMNHGRYRYSFSHYGYNTAQAAKRCLYKMLSRPDVFKAKILKGGNLHEKKKKN